MTDVTPEPIFQVASGFMAAKLLFVANEVGLFAQLADGPATLDALAGRTGIAQPRLRILAIEGDCFKDPIPEGHDVVLIANVFHLFSAKRNLELLRRTRQSVPDGARLLLADFWTDATHTQPTFAALMAGEFLVITGEGDVYSEEEVQGWLQETGWRLLERKPLAGPQSVIVAETTQ